MLRQKLQHPSTRRIGSDKIGRSAVIPVRTCAGCCGRYLQTSKSQAETQMGVARHLSYNYIYCKNERLVIWIFAMMLQFPLHTYTLGPSPEKWRYRISQIQE